ncbi:glycoside hydrolase family 16 protein [Vararia minispora EC-137]|uniref:Glycoside hydrolase family 16 protein n=1 Tax=Vararia minispora EC-137 TaxID=1314806 RepID=A0ACB8QJR0_9AGAM|nr:glycoside hydrolase family 16 protein [Vararia minispora EC-137]
MLRYTFSLSLLASYILSTHAATVFFKQDEFIGTSFLDHFEWETFDDPTHGRVNYVDRDTALQHNLSFATTNKFVMRADSWSIVPPGARGRDSIRISSRSAYDEAVFVLDLSHMPTGCATWPAFWTLSAAGPWPTGGEIDIIEGVNLGNQNLASLHTLPNCAVLQNRSQTGTTISTDCDAQANSNQGCDCDLTAQAQSTSAPSFGSPFNDGGGGFYAMSKTRGGGIAVWFWPRNSRSVPVEILNGGATVVPSVSWGTPAAYFPLGDNCPYDGHFDAHKMVFDLTFCGDWAGSVWSTSGCGVGTCEDYVNNNPHAFEDAYWEVNSLRIYTPVTGGW